MVAEELAESEPEAEEDDELLQACRVRNRSPIPMMDKCLNLVME
jgi:hypothetical protein